jgi:hypothetical protein
VIKGSKISNRLYEGRLLFVLVDLSLRIDRMAWYNLELEEPVNRPFPSLHTRSVEKILFLK